jgi:hypothetical protein
MGHVQLMICVEFVEETIQLARDAQKLVLLTTMRLQRLTMDLVATNF